MKIKKIIKTAIIKIFGTKNNIKSKFCFSCLFAGILFYRLSILFLNDNNNLQQFNIYIIISGIFISTWVLFIGNYKSIFELIIEFLRKIFAFYILFSSLDFFINNSLNFVGIKLIFYSIFYSILILLPLFYFTSRFIDILNYIKIVFKYFKNVLFGSEKQTTSKIISLIENITAFITAISGLGLAIKMIIEPLFNLIK